MKIALLGDIALLDAEGFDSREGSWKEIPLNAPQELLRLYIDEVSRD